jgi:hypothetical protein
LRALLAAGFFVAAFSSAAGAAAFFVSFAFGSGRASLLNEIVT